MSHSPHAVRRALVALAAACSLLAAGAGQSVGLAQPTATSRVLYIHNGKIILSDLSHSFTKSLGSASGQGNIGFGESGQWWRSSSVYTGWSHDGRYVLSEPAYSFLLNEGITTAKVYAPSGRLLHRINYSAVQSPANLTAGPYWALDSDKLVYGGVPRTGHAGNISVWKEGLAGSLSLLWPRYQSQLNDNFGFFGGGILVSFGNGVDPAREMLSDDTSANRTSVLWSLQRKTGISYSSREKWSFASLRDGAHLTGFAPGLAVAADGQNVAGVAQKKAGAFGGRILVTPLSGGHHRRFVGKGSDPTWSSDGKWLFYAQNTRIKALKFRVRAARFHGFPFGGTGSLSSSRWAGVSSPVNRISIIRVHPDGSDRQTVATTTGYGITSMNVLSDDKTVVFEYVASDQTLAKRAHKTHGLSRQAIYKHYPRPLIETATLGGTPRILMTGRNPVVQP
jgi:hypothetical protein